MNIQSGKLYENRTWKYLYPSLKFYGEELTVKLSSFLKLAVGVNDSYREKNGNCIYILIDTELSSVTALERQAYRTKFGEFLKWVKDKYYYVTDYVFEKGKHMVVLRLHKNFENSYMHFIKGDYSEMYPDKIIYDYFKHVTLANKEVQKKRNDKMKIIRDILKKNSEYLPKFVAQVNKDFKTNVDVSYFKDAELDYPPVRKEEIFNYKKKGLI